MWMGYNLVNFSFLSLSLLGKSLSVLDLMTIESLAMYVYWRVLVEINPISSILKLALQDSPFFKLMTYATSQWHTQLPLFCLKGRPRHYYFVQKVILTLHQHVECSEVEELECKAEEGWLWEVAGGLVCWQWRFVVHGGSGHFTSPKPQELFGSSIR